MTEPARITNEVDYRRILYLVPVHLALPTFELPPHSSLLNTAFISPDGRMVPIALDPSSLVGDYAQPHQARTQCHPD
jgi:hypothetical protein